MEDRFAYVQAWHTKFTEGGWWHSFELPDGRIIEGVATLESLRNRIAQFPIPARLAGKRVLDIGTWDGWFAFEMERRGAEVMAIDCWDNPRFHEIHQALGSRVDYRQMDVYELTPERIGRFDIVLFMGVLYHLKHPLLALERVCALTTELAAVDSFVLTEERLPGAGVDRRALLEFYETDEFGGQTSNWCGPTVPCLMAFCRTAGFARVELQNVLEYGACIACYRKWEPPPPDAPDGPDVKDVFHAVNYGINFQTSYDEYVACLFRWPGAQLKRENVKPEVAGYGVTPISVSPRGSDVWQANFKLPPGLAPGWHEAGLRIGASGPSRTHRIAVDIPFEISNLAIRGVNDALTAGPNQVDLRRGRWLSLWVEGLPENADRNNLRIFAGEHRLPVTYLEVPGNQVRQMNVELPDGVQPGSYQVLVVIGGHRSAPAPVKISA